MKYKVYELTPRTKKWQPVGYWLPLEEGFEKAGDLARDTGRHVELRDKDGVAWCGWKLEGSNHETEN